MNKTGSVEKNPNVADKQKNLGGPVALSSCVISMIGREIEVKTIDGETWAGTLKACSSNFDIGLGYARKCPISEDHKGCIVDAVPKMEFKSQDVVAIAAPLEEVKTNKFIPNQKGFATDGQIADVDYAATKDKERKIEKEFVEWEQDDDDDPSDWQVNSISRSNYLSGGRNKIWSPEEMMRANKDLGVVSSFKEDLSQYTTVEAIGDEDQRKRADQIASQIENSTSSRKNAALENDDYERDLDKATDHPNRNRNGNDFSNVNNKRGQKFPNNRPSYTNQSKRFDKPNKDPDFMGKRMQVPPRAEVAPTPAASSSVKVPAVQPSLSSSATVAQKPTDEKTGPSASQAFAKSSNVISNENSVSVEGHSRENLENLDQKEPVVVAQLKSTDESHKGESLAEGSGKSSFVFNPDARPFVPTVKQESPANSASMTQQPQIAAVPPFQTTSNTSMIPTMVQMQPSGYYVAPTSFQPSHSLPPPNSYVAGQQMVQNTAGFVNAQQYYQQGGHPMIMGQSAVSHGYPSTANQTLPTSSISSSHQMIPMVQNPMNYPLNNGSLQMVLPMHQMTYYPPVTAIPHSGPPPNYMPGQPMVMAAPHGQYLNQPQFYQQNNNQ